MLINTMPHTDIKSEGWISRLPQNVRPYALLMRLDRPIGVWLLLLPCWWGMMVATRGLQGFFGYDWAVVGLFALGAVVMRAAGCIINDLWDRKLDAQVERTQNRPLASGAVSVRGALVLLAALLLLGLLILLGIRSYTVFILGLCSLPLIISYPYMKRITWWPQLFLGLSFGFGVLIGYAAISQELGIVAYLLYASCICWTIGYDTIYAHQDKADDMLVGIKSTALLFGKRSKVIVGLFYLASFLLLVTAVTIEGVTPLVIALMAIAWLHLVWQIFRWQPEDAENSLQIFKSNRDYGLIVLVILSLNSFA